jgi:toxin HigB-1
VNYYFYGTEMIECFADAETEKVFRGFVSRKLSGDIQRTARRKLLQLDAAVELAFLRIPPGNRLEALQGRRSGQHSIRIDDQWRICFRWEEGRVYEVEIIEYH